MSPDFSQIDLPFTAKANFTAALLLLDHMIQLLTNYLLFIRLLQKH